MRSHQAGGLAGAARLDRLGTFFGAAVVGVAQAHLGRHRHLRRDRAAHRRDDARQRLRVLQQRGAATVAVDDLGRAAEVQVDAGRPESGQPRRVLGQAHRVRPQQLHTHRHTSGRAALVVEFGHHPFESARRQHRVGHTDELRHTQVNAAHTRERVTQTVVEQAFHRGKPDRHARASGQ